MEFRRLKLSSCRINSEELDIFYKNEKHPVDIMTPFPIIVEKNRSKFDVIYGFQKYRNYKNKNYTEIPAYILENPTLIKKVTTLIRYQRNQRELYPIEIAKIIKILLSSGVEKKVIATDIADSLGINRGYKLTDKYLELNTIPQYIIDFLLLKTDSLKIWSRFTNRNENIFKIILDYTSPTLSEFLEIEKNLFEIAKRQNSSIDEAAAEYNLFSIIQENAQNIKKIRKILQEIRYPILSRHRTRINNELKNLKVPENLFVEPDKSLETKSISLSAHITSEEDISRLRNFLNEENVSKLKDILDLL